MTEAKHLNSQECAVCAIPIHQDLDIVAATVWLQYPAEQPDTRDWHARRELPPMPEGQKQPARQSNDPVQRTEPLPARREGSQQDLRAPRSTSSRLQSGRQPLMAPQQRQQLHQRYIVS